MKIKIYESNNNYFFKPKKFKLLVDNNDVNVLIDCKKKYQSLMGFGGAITESSAYIYSLLNNNQKALFLSSIYGTNGLNYSLARLTIGSCDFSLKSYDYLDENNVFTLEHENKYLFPLLNDIKEKKELTFMASSWSPLAKYKDNNDKLHGGHLLKEHYKDYALYLTNYVKQMRLNGFPISMMTIQNEPQAIQTWESCIFSVKEESEFGKVLYNSLKEINEDVDLYIWDHNKDVIIDRVEKTLEDKEFHSYVKGIAYHWYDNGCNENLKVLKDKYPDLNLLFTEGCIELLLDKSNDKFRHAIRYAKEYIKDINYGSSGFIDWNILLDEKGGPNHVGNFCEALIQYDRINKELIFNPSYYYVMHLSKFIQPNARRLEIDNKTNLLMTSVINPNGEIVIVVLNEDKATYLNLLCNEVKFSVYSEKQSLMTMVINKEG